MKKKIFIFTGSRADYGILKNLIKDFKKDKNIITKTIVGGSHFSKKFGFSFKEILSDKIKIDYKISIKILDTKEIDLVNFVSQSISKYGKILKKDKPDYVILLGDRFETFSFAIVCYFLNIKLIHIHGGELTTGSFDDNIRHSISKLSNYHFVTHKTYKKRLIQMGENKKDIFNVGSLGVENYLETIKDKKEHFLKKFKLPKDKKIALVTFHPETRGKFSYKDQIKIFLSSLHNVKKIFYIFTYNNMDTSGSFFIDQLEKFKKKNTNSRIDRSMGSNMYFNFLKNVDLVIGNSSSGIIEAPSAKTLTLNIGTRQDGRIFSKSIFKCDLNKQQINNFLKKMLNFKMKNFSNPLQGKRTREKMIKIIKNKIFYHKNNIKKFNDIKF